MQLDVSQDLKFTKTFIMSSFYHSLKLFKFIRVHDFYIQEATLDLFII